MSTFDPSTLRPGDVLLYRGTGRYSRIIFEKTWHDVSHVEIAISATESVASRDGQGVWRYPTRLADLVYVLRPTVPFNLITAMAWFKTVEGQPYAWLDMAQFAGLNIDQAGMMCSPFGTWLLRQGAVPVFNHEPAEKIAPFQFLTSELLEVIWQTDAPAVPSPKMATVTQAITVAQGLFKIFGRKPKP